MDQTEVVMEVAPTLEGIETTRIIMLSDFVDESAEEPVEQKPSWDHPGVEEEDEQ